MDERVARFIERNDNKYWGKYRGIVEAHDDPEQLGRLKVRVPSVLGSAVTGWAWPAIPAAGPNVGVFFLPHRDDLVWVEFAEGELDEPVWTAATWPMPAGKSAVPEEARQDYPDRVVVKSRAGHVIELSDAQGKETITVRAKDGTEIVLDGTSGTIAITAKTVTVQAPKVRGAKGANPAEELVTKSWLEGVYNSHTHPSGVGPTAAPTPVPTPHANTTVLVAE